MYLHHLMAYWAESCIFKKTHFSKIAAGGHIVFQIMLIFELDLALSELQTSVKFLKNQRLHSKVISRTSSLVKVAMAAILVARTRPKIKLVQDNMMIKIPTKFN